MLTEKNKHYISSEYYDSDYPAKWDSNYPENFDHTVCSQGIEADVERYIEIASNCGNNILEICCGTGRVALPLAKSGKKVTGVDISNEMLRIFRDKLLNEKKAVSDNISLIEQDVSKLKLEKRNFDLTICAFNSLMCIPDFHLQCKTIIQAAEHLKMGGLFILDIINPLTMNLQGISEPEPFFTRINERTGNKYTRFAACSPLDEDQRQELFGRYEEIESNETIKKTDYSIIWRPIFRFEIELMLNQAGFKIIKVEGGHHKEAFSSSSRKMFITAAKVK